MALQSWPRRTIVLALAMLSAFAFLGEAALRIARFGYPTAAERDVIWSPERDPALFEKRLYRRDEHEIWKPVPGAELPWAPGEQLDMSGFRGEAVPLARTPGVVRIAILGSDEALGVGLPLESTWPCLLRQVIEAHGARAEVLCAAVENSTLRQGIERWRAEVRPCHPDLVLCTFAGEYESRAANRGCSDAQRIADNGGLGFPDPRERPGQLPAWARDLRLLQCSRWIADVLDGDYWSWLAGELEERRLRPLEQRFDARGTRRVSAHEFTELARQLRDEVEAERCKLILFPIVGEQAVRGQSGAVRDYQTLLVEAAVREKIPRISALDRFEIALRAGSRIEDFFSEGRLNPRGHKFVADEIGHVIVPRLKELKF
jgi:hypothetical protein